MKSKFQGLSFLSRMERCPICAGRKLVSVFTDSDLHLDRCVTCEVVFVNPQPTKTSISNLYSRDYFQEIYHAQEQACIGYFEAVMQQIAAQQAPGRLLEVGPGPGYFLRVCAAAGWDVTGVELSAYAADRLRGRWGFQIYDGTIDQLPSHAVGFNAGVMWDVLEHTPDPLGCLTHLRGRLCSNGLLCLKVPNVGGLRPYLNRLMTGETLRKRLPRILTIENYFADHGFHHLFYFSRRSLKELLRLAGFTQVAIRTVPEPAYDRDEPTWKTLARHAVEGIAWATGQRESLLAFSRCRSM